MTELLPCPFCGGNASFEHLENTRWSIGCADIDGDCMGFQSLQTFSRKAEALAAWNRRPTSAGQSNREAVLAYPDNALKEQVRDISETLSAFDVIAGAASAGQSEEVAAFLATLPIGDFPGTTYAEKQETARRYLAALDLPAEAETQRLREQVERLAKMLEWACSGKGGWQYAAKEVLADYPKDEIQ